MHMYNTAANDLQHNFRAPRGMMAQRTTTHLAHMRVRGCAGWTKCMRWCPAWPHEITMLACFFFVVLVLSSPIRRTGEISVSVCVYRAHALFVCHGISGALSAIDACAFLERRRRARHEHTHTHTPGPPLPSCGPACQKPSQQRRRNGIRDQMQIVIVESHIWPISGNLFGCIVCVMLCVCVCM